MKIENKFSYKILKINIEKNNNDSNKDYRNWSSIK